MSKRLVFLLWIVAIALGGAIAFLKFGRKQAVAEQTARTPGQTLLESFPADQVAAIDIQGAGDSAVHLAKKDGKWTVAERDGYPANASTINGILRTLEDLKVTQGIQAGTSFLARFGLDENASTLEKHGYTLTFKDAGGKEIAKLSLDQRKDEEGNGVSPFAGSGPNGRFIRNHADTSGVYRVGESFATLTDDPKRLIAEEFIQVEKIKSVSVTAPDKADIAWNLKRDTEEGAFTLDGAAPGETLDTTATDPLKSLFSYSRIDDVIPAAKVAERIQAEGKRVATIETFEGITYKITFTPLKPTTPPPAADPNSPPPTPSEGYAVTVEVAGEAPKERAKEANEKPEDAKVKDTAFEDRKKVLTERLAKEKALAGRTFEVAKYSLEALLKDRAALIKKDPPPADPAAPGAPAAPGTAPAVPGLPGAATPRPTGPIEAVTPPIAVPPLPDTPKEEPVPMPDADKPAPPKPATETPKADKPAETPPATEKTATEKPATEKPGKPAETKPEAPPAAKEGPAAAP